MGLMKIRWTRFLEELCPSVQKLSTPHNCDYTRDASFLAKAGSKGCMSIEFDKFGWHPGFQSRGCGGGRGWWVQYLRPGNGSVASSTHPGRPGVKPRWYRRERWIQRGEMRSRVYLELHTVFESGHVVRHQDRLHEAQLWSITLHRLITAILTHDNMAKATGYRTITSIAMRPLKSDARIYYP